jgi:hypothetical protein
MYLSCCLSRYVRGTVSLRRGVGCPQGGNLLTYFNELRRGLVHITHKFKSCELFLACFFVSSRDAPTFWPRDHEFTTTDLNPQVSGYTSRAEHLQSRRARAPGHRPLQATRNTDAQYAMCLSSQRSDLRLQPYNSTQRSVSQSHTVTKFTPCHVVTPCHVSSSHVSSHLAMSFAGAGQQFIIS